MRELILQDVSTYPNSSISEISQRIGVEIPFRKVKEQLYQLITDKQLSSRGKLKGTKYFIDKVA